MQFLGQKWIPALRASSVSGVQRPKACNYRGKNGFLLCGTGGLSWMFRQQIPVAGGIRHFIEEKKPKALYLGWSGPPQNENFKIQVVVSLYEFSWYLVIRFHVSGRYVVLKRLRAYKSFNLHWDIIFHSTPIGRPYPKQDIGLKYPDRAVRTVTASLVPYYGSSVSTFKGELLRRRSVLF
jgi:hypothetical protein